MPHRGDNIHTSLPGITARTIDLVQGESPKIWYATIKYSNEQEDDPDEEESDDPLAEPTDISISPFTTEEPFIKDIDDKGVINSAGHQFDPLPTKTVYNLQYTLKRNERNFDADLVASLMGNLNSAPFFTHDAKTVRLVGVGTTSRYFRHPQTGLEFDYFAVTYTLITGQKEHIEILDRGWMCKEANGDIVNCRDANQEAVRSMVRLDGEGAPIPREAESHFIKFKTDDGEGFDALSLP